MSQYSGIGSESASASEYTHVAGAGKLSPGTYHNVKIDFITNYDTHAVIRLSVNKDTYHLEAVYEWPSWWHEGLIISVEIGLSGGVVLSKNGDKYRALEALDGHVLHPWTSKLGDIVSLISRKNWKLAVPSIKKVWTDKHAYTFTKTKTLDSATASALLKGSGPGG